MFLHFFGFADSLRLFELEQNTDLYLRGFRPLQLDALLQWSQRVAGQQYWDREALQQQVMQVWMELGAVGVALLYATVITGARAVLARSQDIRVAAAIMGTFVSMLTIWLLSFGVWQGWWMSVLGLAAAACVYVSMTFAQDADHTGD